MERTVRPCGPRHAVVVGTMLAQAFLDDPVMHWLQPLRSRRAAMLRRLFVVQLSHEYLTDRDADWLDLITRGVADFPKGKTVVPKRPKATALAALTAQTTVILAEHSKVHDSNGTADKTHAALPAATTIILPGATHHTLPMSPAPALNSILKTALD